MQNHKLEIIDAGSKSLDEMAGIVAQIFDVDPVRLELMRVDLTADLYRVPMMTLYENMRVKFKRSCNERGELEYETIGARLLEYMRFGRSPNCVRAYNKPAECEARMPVILKSMTAGSPKPTYEELFGFPRDTILSRVERQIGGQRFPPALTTFLDLYRADEFDPFTSIEIVPAEFCAPDPEVVGAAHSLKLLGLQQMITKHGYHRARAMLNCQGNAKRHFDDLREFQEDMAPAMALTTASITDRYRESVRRQIDGRVMLPLASQSQKLLSSGGR